MASYHCFITLYSPEDAPKLQTFLRRRKFTVMDRYADFDDGLDRGITTSWTTLKDSCLSDSKQAGAAMYLFIERGWGYNTCTEPKLVSPKKLIEIIKESGLPFFSCFVYDPDNTGWFWAEVGFQITAVNQQFNVTTPPSIVEVIAKKVKKKAAVKKAVKKLAPKKAAKRVAYR